MVDVSSKSWLITGGQLIILMFPVSIAMVPERLPLKWADYIHVPPSSYCCRSTLWWGQFAGYTNIQPIYTWRYPWYVNMWSYVYTFNYVYIYDYMYITCFVVLLIYNPTIPEYGGLFTVVPTCISSKLYAHTWAWVPCMVHIMCIHICIQIYTWNTRTYKTSPAFNTVEFPCYELPTRVQ